MPITRSKAKTMQQSMDDTAVSDTEQSPKKRKQTTITSTGQLNYSSVVVQDHNETTTSSISSTWSETRTSCGDKRKRPYGNGGSSGMKSSSSNGCPLASGMKSSRPDGSSSEPWGSTQNFRPENPNPDDSDQGSPLWTMTLPYRLKNGWPFIDDVGVQGSNSSNIDVLPSVRAVGLRSSNSNNSDKTKSAASALIEAVTKTSLPRPYGKPVVWAEVQ